jgi:hypothetical protein
MADGDENAVDRTFGDFAGFDVAQLDGVDGGVTLNLFNDCIPNKADLIVFLGAPLQDAVALVLDTFRGWALEPLAGVLPAAFYGFLVDGLYDGIGTVASFVPVIILFFFFMAVVEDSGYLARAAFLTDSLMARLGWMDAAS